MDFSIGFCIFIFVTMFASFFVKGLAGFGDPLISTPLLSLSQLQNSEITPMNLLVSWPINCYIALKNRKSFSVRSTLPMVTWILVGMIPGMFLLKYASSWILKAVLGLTILLIGVEMLTRKQAATAGGNPVVMAVVSILSGLTAGLFGINLFFVAYIERTGYVNRSQFRGQMCFIFFIENTVRLISYIFVGMYTADVLKLTAVAVPGVVLGLFLGSRVDSKLSEATVKRIITIVFMFAGLSALVKAVIFKV